MVRFRDATNTQRFMPVIVAAMVKIVANVFRKMYEMLDANENGLIIMSDAVAAVSAGCWNR